MTQALPARQAFIGVGTMGGLMAGLLLDAGVDLTVHDLRRRVAQPLLARGAKWATNPESAVSGCEVVWLSLPGPEQVESVLLGDYEAVLAEMPPGTVLVDTTTNDPEVARRVASACRDRGIVMLDAPVSGRPPTMTMMVGGDQGEYEKAMPLLQSVAAQLFYVGPAGAGCIAKLATQYMGYTNLIAAIEGMLIARMGGIDPEVMAEIVPVSAAASRAFNIIPNTVLDGSYHAGGTLDIVAKDMALVCALAERLDAPAHTGRVAEALYEAAQDVGWGSEGYVVVARFLEEMAKTRLRG